ncbi:MAG: hypothetical protein MUF87_08850 [Anaerolineae bacterium]|jgi:hypothetical protein|nr:hypothetical protein [Anaerolineae bacterium]
MLPKIALLTLLFMVSSVLQGTAYYVVDELILTTDGQRLNGTIYWNVPTADGRYVLFLATGSNLLQGGGLMRYDRQTGEVRHIDPMPDHVPGATNAMISDNGRFVLADYRPSAGPRYTFGYLYDLETNTTRRLGRGTNATDVHGDDMTPDGRYILYSSNATNMFDGINNLPCAVLDYERFACFHVFLWDRVTGRQVRVSLNQAGVAANNNNQAAQISNDGRYITFLSDATNLVGPNRECMSSPDSTWSYPCWNLYHRDLVTGQIERVNYRPDGTLIRDMRWPWGLFDYTLSGDGRYVVFTDSDNRHGSNANYFIYLRDTLTDRTELINVETDGTPISQARTWGHNAISSDGRFVVFGIYDGAENKVYLRDRVLQTTTVVNQTNSGLLEPFAVRSPFGQISITPNGREIFFGVDNDPNDNTTFPFRLMVSARPRLIDHNLLINGSFENTTSAWRLINPVRDRIVCDLSLVTQGNCAFQLTANPNVLTRLSQSITTSSGVLGDTLTLSADVMGRTFTGGRILATIFYADGTSALLELDPAAINNGTYSYVTLTDSQLLTGLVRQVKVEIRVRDGTGRLTVDNVQLRLTEGPGFGSGGGAPLIPMP